MKIGFDNDKYLKMQSEHIKERIQKFGGKLYLEFGGKLFDDWHGYVRQRQAVRAGRGIGGVRAGQGERGGLHTEDDYGVFAGLGAESGRRGRGHGRRAH